MSAKYLLRETLMGLPYSGSSVQPISFPDASGGVILDPERTDLDVAHSARLTRPLSVDRRRVGER